MFATSPETSDHLAQGQVVIVTTRWILILAGILLALWNPAEIAQLRTQIAVIFILASVNFYLHAQLLIRRPVIDRVVYGASAADIAVITSIIMAAGPESNEYIFYFPAILAFSVAFPMAITVAYTGGVVLIYGFISTVA